jgi:hypothetical protein
MEAYVKKHAFVLGAAFCLIIVLLLVVSAGAHDNPEDWIGQERRTNAAGQLCCGRGDCFPFEAKQMITTPAGVAFPDEPENIIPFDKFAPSMDRFHWRCRWGGETKCVFAPLGSS